MQKTPFKRGVDSEGPPQAATGHSDGESPMRRSAYEMYFILKKKTKQERERVAGAKSSPERSVNDGTPFTHAVRPPPEAYPRQEGRNRHFTSGQDGMQRALKKEECTVTAEISFGAGVTV